MSNALLSVISAAIAEQTRAVGHNCAIDGVHVVDIPDDGHSWPVVGKVALPVFVSLNKDNCSQSAGFSGEAESANAGEQVNVGFIIHNPSSCCPVAGKLPFRLRNVLASDWLASR